MNDEIIENEIEMLLANLHDFMYKRMYFKDNNNIEMYNHFHAEVQRVINRLSFLYLYKSFDYLKK